MILCLFFRWMWKVVFGSVLLMVFLNLMELFFDM